MNSRQMLDELSRQFRLIIRNEYHVQIEVERGKYHDIWPLRHGGLKVKLLGMHHAKTYHDTRHLLNRLDQYDYRKDSDYAKMLELERLLTKANGVDGIHCDAGFKDGNARLAIIRLRSGDVDLHVRNGVECVSSVEAEIMAIKLAMNFFFAHDKDLTIYSDCRPAVEETLAMYPDAKIKWVSRKGNRGADQAANMRK